MKSEGSAVPQEPRYDDCENLSERVVEVTVNELTGNRGMGDEGGDLVAIRGRVPNDMCGGDKVMHTGATSG